MDRYRFFQFLFILITVYIAYRVVKHELAQDKAKNRETPVVVQSEDLATILRNAVHEESKHNEH